MASHKKLKRVSIIAVITVFIFCGITNSFAASKTTNALETAKAKMYFRALYWCVGSSVSEYTYNIGVFELHNLRSGNWFHSARTTHAGAFVEGDIETNDDEGEGGKDVDDQFYCGNNQTLVHSSLYAINKASESDKDLTVADLACGPNNNNDGIFKYNKKLENTITGETFNTCKDVFDSDYDSYSDRTLGTSADHNFHLNSNRQQNLKTIVQQALGSDPSKFTDEEMYWVLRLGFEYHCTTVNSKNEAAANGKVYKILDANGNPKDYTASKKAFGNVRVNTENNVGLFQSMTEDAFAYQDESGNIQKGQIGTCSDLEAILSNKDNKYTKAFLAAAKEDEESGEHVADSPEDTAPDADNNLVKNDECKKVSGLGWLVCPIIEMLGDALPKMYTNLIEPYLEVESSLFGDNASSGGIGDAWSVFVTFADVFLIIYLLVIIFSQLTGYGIDNYGIKKTLPRLLIAALLINLSYVICQLAADVTNLLGYNLYRFFETLANDFNTSHQVVLSETGTGGAAVGLTAIFLGIVAAVVGIVYATGGTVILAMLPGVLTALIGAIFAVLFFFIILGVRKAAVIILIVISPLAFACYMLPNTKKFFDKWKKLFTTLLLVYPIAGLLMGGGAFASVVLLSTGSDQTWTQIAALLVNVIPFFFLPSLIKGSMAGLGNIGNKISGIGKRAGSKLGGAAGRGLQNSNLHQSNMEAAKKLGALHRKGIYEPATNSAIKKAGYKDKDGNLIDSWDKLSQEQKEDFQKKHRALGRRNATDSEIITSDNAMLSKRAANSGDAYIAAASAAASTNEEKGYNSEMLYNNEFFDEFRDEDGNEYRHGKDGQLHKVGKDGQLEKEAYNPNKEITDKNGNKYKTNEKGQLINAKTGEKYKRKEFKGDDNKNYHWQDGKLVDENGKALEAGKTVYDERGVGYQFAGEKDGEHQYKVSDIKPPKDIDKDATYMVGDKEYKMNKAGRLVDKEGNVLEKGATVRANSGRNTGCEYKVDENGNLALQKSANIQTTDGKNLAFYSDGKGGFKLKDVDKVNKANSLIDDLKATGGIDKKATGSLSELQQELEVTGKAIEKAKQEGNFELEAKYRSDYSKLTEAISAVKTQDVADGELQIGKKGSAGAKFGYRQGSGMLSALEGPLENDTAGFKYTDKKGNSHDLRVREDGMLETVPTEAGTQAEIMKSKGLIKSTYRNDGSGVFRDIETGNTATEAQVKAARDNDRVKTYGQLQVEQSRVSDATQVGNAVGVLSADMASYTQGAILGAQNRTVGNVNSTIGEGQALIVNHTNGVDTATAVETAAQNANKQFEGVMGSNIAARERKANFVLDNFDRNDILDIASGDNAVDNLQAVVNSDTASQAKKDLAQQMLDHGIYMGGGHIQVDANGRRAIEDFVNTYGGRPDSAPLTAGQTAAIERLTPEERQEVRTALNGTYSAQQEFLNNPDVSEGQKLYMQQILNGDGIIEARSYDPGIMDAHMDLATQGQVEASNSIIGKTKLQAQQAATVGAVKAENQFKQEITANAVGEVEMDADVLARQAQNEYNLKFAKNDINITPNITASYAGALEKQRFDISQEKMFDEEFKLMPKGEMLTRLRTPPAEYANDPNYTRSLLKGIMQKGGDDDIMQFALNRTRTDDAEIERVYDEFYAASTEPTQKAYGKFVSDLKNLGVDAGSLPTFSQWCDGSYTLTMGGTPYDYDGTKYRSLQSYIDNIGNESLQTASKGFIKVMSQNPVISSKYEPHDVLYGMVHNRDNEAQAEIRTYISNWSIGDRISAMQTLSDSEIAHMTETDWNAVFGGDIRHQRLASFAGDGADTERIRGILTDPRLKNFVPKNVKDFIGMPSGPATPPPDTPE